MASRLAGIEGVRGLAALAIVVYHVHVATVVPGELGPGLAESVVRHAWLGVPLFFVLSGFLLYRPYVRATLHGGGWPSLARYARSRALRILPAYWVALTVLIFFTNPRAAPVTIPALVAMTGLAHRRRAGRGGMAWSAAAVALGLMALTAIAAVPATEPSDWWRFAQNYLFLHFNLEGPVVIGASWTLCIEVTFYLALPAVAAAIHAVGARRPTLPGRGRAIAAALILLVPIGVTYQALLAERRWDLLPGYFDQFAMGMLLALAYEYRQGGRLGASAARLVAAGAVAVALVATLLEHVGPTARMATGESVFYRPLMAASFALVLATMLLGPESSVLARALRARAVIWLGVVSYGVFLWHYPLLNELLEHGAPLAHVPFLARVVLVAAVAAVVAAVSWVLVERPALALKDRPRAGTPKPVTAALKPAPQRA